MIHATNSALTRHSTSFIIRDVPTTIYQTIILEDNTQDSSTPLVIEIQLSDTAFEAFSATSDVGSKVFASLRRFDGHHVPLYCEHEHTMKILTLPKDVFEYELNVQSSTLYVKIYRKYLPVSKNFGNIPFRFAFLLRPTNEVVMTDSCVIGSKQPKSTPRAPPKRIRAPPSRQPFASNATNEDTTIDRFFTGDLLHVGSHEITSQISGLTEVQSITAANNQASAVENELGCQSSTVNDTLSSYESSVSCSMVDEQQLYETVGADEVGQKRQRISDNNEQQSVELNTRSSSRCSVTSSLGTMDPLATEVDEFYKPCTTWDVACFEDETFDFGLNEDSTSIPFADDATLSVMGLCTF